MDTKQSASTAAAPENSKTTPAADSEFTLTDNPTLILWWLKLGLPVEWETDTGFALLTESVVEGWIRYIESNDYNRPIYAKYLHRRFRLARS